MIKVTHIMLALRHCFTGVARYGEREKAGFRKKGSNKSKRKKRLKKNEERLKEKERI
jgi:hypothetical protein